MNMHVSPAQTAIIPPRRASSAAKSVTVYYAEFERARAATAGLSNPRDYNRAVSKCVAIVEKLCAAPSCSAEEMLLKMKASAWSSSDTLDLGEGLASLEDANILLTGLHGDLQRLAPLPSIAEPRPKTVTAAYFEKVIAAELPADESILIPLYEAYRAADEALQGVFNKPRSRGRGADLIEDEQERARGYTNAIALKLSQLTQIKEGWKELYLETMLSHSFYIGGDAPEATEVIARFNSLQIVEPMLG